MKGTAHTLQYVDFIVNEYDTNGHAACPFTADLTTVFGRSTKSNLLLSAMAGSLESSDDCRSTAVYGEAVADDVGRV
jgi:hypothetical protein